MPETIRWSIKVSIETDLSLRTFLGVQGMKKGGISRFVEDAVQWRLLEQTREQLASRNQDLSPDDLESLIEDEARAVRTESIGASRQHRWSASRSSQSLRDL